jgi:hypothetical protein
MSYVDQAGNYRAKVTQEPTLCRSSNGTEQIAIQFMVVDGGPQNGRTIMAYKFLTEAAIKYTVETLRTLGWQGDDLSDLRTVGSAGEVEIVVHEDMYNEKVYLKVAFVNDLNRTATPKGAMNEQERKEFASRMKALVRGCAPAKSNGATKAQAPAQQPQRPEPPPPTDADLPF